jgi:opacity protein-like surface antigen
MVNSMMKKLALLLMTASISIAALAKEETIPKNNIYVGAGLGVFTAQRFRDTEDSLYFRGTPKARSPLVNLLVGHRFNQYLRADINGQYRRINYSANQLTPPANSRQRIDNVSIFLNGYVDVPNNSLFVPYFTCGLGYSHNNASALKFRATNLPVDNVDASGRKTNNFAWNAGLGTKVKIYKNVEVDISYRYADLGKVSIKSSTNLAGHSFDAASQRLKLHQGLLSVIYHI